MNRVAAFAGLLAWSWALVAAADARHEAKPVEVIWHTHVVEVEAERAWSDALEVETPVIDSLMGEGWEEEVDRQSDCLFEFIRDHVGHEITLDVVLAAGYWTDALGGACLVIGEDDE